MDMANSEAHTDEARWQAVLARDASQNGIFFYAVSSTGIYCLPSCPSRRPQRLHVSFYRTSAEAEQAGFRPCKRCHPQRGGLLGGQQARHQEIVAQCCRLLAAGNADGQPLSLQVLAQQVGVSSFHLHRLFKAHTGLTPKAYASALRMQTLRQALNQQSSVTQAIFEAGFNASSRFYAQAGPALGMRPSEYRRGGEQLRIAHAVVPSPLGLVLVAASAKGVCAVFLGEDAAQLQLALQQAFPRASLVAGGADFAGWLQQVLQALSSVSAPILDLPLDLRGTAFQLRVWELLKQIPPGSTMTYSELAARLGQPKAIRAVASACAANKLAVLVPCHRVVRSDGNLAGYRWGLPLKRKLLELEQSCDE